MTIIGFTSLLVLIHVIIGNHMLLGALKSIVDLNWYPLQPLNSKFGWASIIVVALVLTWKNSNGLLSLSYSIFEFTTGQNPRSTDGYLKFLDAICGILIASTYLFKLFCSELQSGRHWIPLILLLVIAVKYFLSRLSVTQELAIGKSLFHHVPNDLQTTNRRAIALQVFGFMALYAALGLFSDNIYIAALMMTGIACGDYFTRELINARIRRWFDDPQYALDPANPDSPSIAARRRVAEWYLFALPHRWKELGCIVGSAAALAVAIYGHYR